MKTTWFDLPDATYVRSQTCSVTSRFGQEGVTFAAICIFRATTRTFRDIPANMAAQWSTSCTLERASFRPADVEPDQLA